MNRLRQTKIAIVHALALMLALSTCHPLNAADTGKTLYRWVDENGHVQYSDQLPPQYAPEGHDVISTTGATKERVPKAKTKEEIAKAKRETALKEAEKAKTEAEKAAQAAADRRLLEAYGSAESIQTMLTEKTALIEASIGLSENRIKKLGNQLTKLNTEAARVERSGSPVSDDIKKEMSDINNQIENQKKSIVEQRAEQARLKKAFEADLQRYVELTKPKPTAPINDAVDEQSTSPAN